MAFKDIRQAAQRNDSDAFNDQVDYAYSRRPDQAEVDRDVGLVFERHGFSDWKLTEIRLGKL